VSTFELHAADGAARTGVLRTAHGELRTPAFMPVGTKATVKAIDPAELRQLGAEILLCNTYHLHFRPGADLIAELGGLHRFMAWDGPILTDSGGFQVFSLRHTILRQDDEGLTFRSVYDGDEARFTPELAARIQAQLGSDIAMCLDVVPPSDAPHSDLAEAIERGIDMFDCVLPTRNARTGSALTWEGQLNLKGARFARDPRPLDEGCTCPACTRFSRAYVRHLLNQQEILGLQLLSLHNLRFVLDLVAGARDAIERGRLATYKEEALARLQRSKEAATWAT